MFKIKLLFSSIILFHSTSQADTLVTSVADFDIVDGRFGQTFSATRETLHIISASGRPEYYQFPLTMECWVKWRSGQHNEPILSAGLRDRLHHWSVFVPRWDSGDLAAFFGWCGPVSVTAPLTLKNSEAPNQTINGAGGWHYLAVVIDSTSVRFYIDAKETKVENLPDLGHTPIFNPEQADAFKLMFGCDGVRQSGILIDEVRLSSGVRPIRGIPTEPFVADDQTIGLWHFDKQEDKHYFSDASSLNNPARVILPEKISLNEIDRRSFGAEKSPLNYPVCDVVLMPGCGSFPEMPPIVSLDGTWQMAEGGSDEVRCRGEWTDGFPAEVPGSTHMALFRAGRMADPNLGKNMVEIARLRSYQDYWFKKEFQRPADVFGAMLILEGVCDEYSAWLNGHFLGHHIGKYIPSAYFIEDKLQDSNTLVIKVHAIRREAKNTGQWMEDVAGYGADDDIVIPATTGWHYARLAPQGIWRSVNIECTGTAEIIDPFVVTEDTLSGQIRIILDLRQKSGTVSGELRGMIEPDNFEGKSWQFAHCVEPTIGTARVNLRLTIPEVQPWWPVDLGKPNLYRLRLMFTPTSGDRPAFKDIVFGVRTVETKPLPGGPNPHRYNWQFVINGRPIFLKGANWCFLDLYLELPQKKYDHFVSLAKQQHVQLLRAWGAGMYEPPEFYKACDKLGVMVYQEFPGGPLDITERTVRSFITRMRNHPSLIWYGGGNEVSVPYGPMIQMMGKTALELDGTRPFHRTDPWGGSEHDYSVYWGRGPFELNTKHARSCPFVGEFGFTSMPNYSLVKTYLPEDEADQWPPPEGGSFRWHTPAFDREADYGRDFRIISHYVRMFTDPDSSMKRYIVASQIAQATALRLTLETMRTRWPEAVGVCYYKLTNPVPAGSYATLDYDGTPKISHYFVQDAYQPLHACAIWDNLNPNGKPLNLPIWLLDDSDMLVGQVWEVVARAYNHELEEISRISFTGAGRIDRVKQLGELNLTAEQTSKGVLFVVTEVKKAGVLAGRTFYWSNYEPYPGCLFDLPQTHLVHKYNGDCLEVTNIGAKPAVGVHFVTQSEAEENVASEDGHFWLDVGESRCVQVSNWQDIHPVAWNSFPVESSTVCPNP